MVKETMGEATTEASATVSSEPDNANEYLRVGSLVHLSQIMLTSDKTEVATPPMTMSSPTKVTQQMDNMDDT